MNNVLVLNFCHSLNSNCIKKEGAAVIIVLLTYYCSHMSQLKTNMDVSGSWLMQVPIEKMNLWDYCESVL